VTEVSRVEIVVGADMEPTSLANLPPELLVYIGGARVRDLGRLAAVCSTFRAIFSSPAAFTTALRAALPNVTSQQDARATMRSLTLLDNVTWSPLKQTDADHCAPGTQHNAAVLYGTTLVVFGGYRRPLWGNEPGNLTDEAWALDVRSARWYLAAATGPRPMRRAFNADHGGYGGVLHDGGGRPWLVLFSGSVPGMRDNETWMLGPLGEADSAPTWQWHEIQADGRAQSPSRPSPRFHASVTTVFETGENGMRRDALLLYGGHNFRIDPIDDAHVLSLHQLGETTELASREETPNHIVGLDQVVWQEWSAVVSLLTPSMPQPLVCFVDYHHVVRTCRVPLRMTVSGLVRMHGTLRYGGHRTDTSCSGER
jgi:hypothetical protein